MRPPIFTWLQADSAVIAHLQHDGVLNAFEDEAPQQENGEAYPVPYLCWSVVGGTPENLLGDSPDIDYSRQQFNLYAADGELAQVIYRAVIAVLERRGYIVSFNLTGRDPDTRNFRVSWDMSFWQNR